MNWQSEARTHHAAEGLLLLQEQTAGQALSPAVAASGGEATREQRQQVPQRDLHGSARSHRQGGKWTVGGRGRVGRGGVRRRVWNRGGWTGPSLQGGDDRNVASVAKLLRFINWIRGVVSVSTRAFSQRNTRRWRKYVGRRVREQSTRQRGLINT